MTETPRQELSRLTDAHTELDREFRQSDRKEAAMRSYVARRRPLRARMEQLFGQLSK